MNDDELMDAMADVVIDAIAVATAPLIARIDLLDATVVEMKRLLPREKSVAELIEEERQRYDFR